MNLISEFEAGPITHTELRHQICDALVVMSERYANFVHHQQGLFREFEGYVQYMRGGGWGDNLNLSVIAEILDPPKPFVVITDSHMWVFGHVYVWLFSVVRDMRGVQGFLVVIAFWNVVVVSGLYHVCSLCCIVHKKPTCKRWGPFTGSPPPENISEDTWGEEIVLVFRGEKHYQGVCVILASAGAVFPSVSLLWWWGRGRNLGRRERGLG